MKKVQGKVEMMVLKEEQVIVKRTWIMIVKPDGEHRYECYSDYHTLDGEYIGSTGKGRD